MTNKTMKSIFILSFIFASTPIFADKEDDSSGEETINAPFPCQPFPSCTLDTSSVNSESKFSIWSTVEIKSVAQFNQGTVKARSA